MRPWKIYLTSFDYNALNWKKGITTEVLLRAGEKIVKYFEIRKN